MTGAFTFMVLGQAVGTPVVGRLLDRFAFRLIVDPSWLLYCLSLTLITVVPRALPLFYLPFFFAGVFAGRHPDPLHESHAQAGSTTSAEPRWA